MSQSTGSPNRQHATALTWQWSSDLAEYLQRSEFVCRAVPYAAPIHSASAGDVLLPLHACCLVSSVQFGQVVSYTSEAINVEFRSQGQRQVSSVSVHDLGDYLHRNGFEMVASLPTGLHRVVSVQAP